MNFHQAINTCFQKYAVFVGRATRSEFWWFVLFVAIFDIAISIVDEQLFPRMQYGAIGLIWSLIILLPLIAVGTRRLHDMGRSGWWQLLILTLIGAVLIIVWYCFPSSPGRNDYDEPEAENVLTNS